MSEGGSKRPMVYISNGELLGTLHIRKRETILKSISVWVEFEMK